jgi:hypothetical protein
VKSDKDTLFIIGNGPSLKGVDLKALSPFRSLGMNAAYRYWREINWRPTYYACLDEVVGLSHQDEIVALIKEHKIEKFLLRSNLIQALGEAALDRRIINFDALQYARVGFNDAPTITTGSHATLWGALLGFKNIILLGIDGNYKEIVDGAERRGGIVLELTRESNNPNYFFDGYQAPGDRYCVPNPRPGLHIGAWRDAARNLNHFDCDVYNANPNSEVRYFPFIELQPLLSNGDIVRRPDETAQTISLAEFSFSEQAKDRWSRANQFLQHQWLWCIAPLAFFSAVGIAVIAVKGISFDTVIWAIFAAILYGLILLQLFQRFTLAQVAIDSSKRISALEAQAQEHQRQDSISIRDEMHKADR